MTRGQGNQRRLLHLRYHTTTFLQNLGDKPLHKAKASQPVNEEKKVKIIITHSANSMPMASTNISELVQRETLNNYPKKP